MPPAADAFLYCSVTSMGSLLLSPAWSRLRCMAHLSCTLRSSGADWFSAMSRPSPLIPFPFPHSLLPLPATLHLTLKYGSSFHSFYLRADKRCRLPARPTTLVTDQAAEPFDAVVEVKGIVLDGVDGTDKPYAHLQGLERSPSVSGGSRAKPNKADHAPSSSPSRHPNLTLHM